MIYFLIVLSVIELVVIIYLLKKKPDKDLQKKKLEEELKLEKEISAKKELIWKEIEENKNIRSKEIEEEYNKKIKEINETKENQINQIKSEEAALRSNLSAQVNKEFEDKKLLYIEKLKQLDNDFEKYKENKLIEKELFDQTINEIKNEVESWRQKHSSVIETYKHMEKLQEADNYYKLSLSSEESEEIDELNKVIKKLKNPMPFYKAIYDIYYKNKVNDLVLRVIGKERISGIYKITDISNGKCYVGQSVDIGDRWKQHCKRGCGADVITQNKLYPVMLDKGIENFTFEILESTDDSSKLSAMETYWQEFYQAKSFGYSLR